MSAPGFNITSTFLIKWLPLRFGSWDNTMSQFTNKNICLGSKYYRYTNKTLDQGFPKRMKEGFTGVPSYLDAAILSSNQTQIYLLKNSRFWTFTPSNIPPLEGNFSLPQNWSWNFRIFCNMESINFQSASVQTWGRFCQISVVTQNLPAK